METLLAEKLASEYVRLIAEGWEPDLDEFLSRVPEELREPCREQIEDLVRVGEESALPDEGPEPLEFTFFDGDEDQDEDQDEDEAEIAEATEDLEAVAEEVWQEQFGEPEPEAEPEPEPEPEPEAESEPEPEPLEEVVAAEAPMEQPVEPAEPVGPQRLTKAEAMAMWDTQVRS